MTEPDGVLRPPSFDEFIGQSRICQNLAVYVTAARNRNEPIDHILFSGPPGLGKTTLSHIIANAMGAKIHCSTGPVLDNPADLAGILTKLERGDVFFVDEIHRLKMEVEEFLYSAMEDGKIDLTYGTGASARTMTLQLEPFTLVGATTQEAKLTKPLRDRFGIRETLELYSEDESRKIARRTAAILGCELTDEAADIVAAAGRGVPRNINSFMRRLRDIVEVAGGTKIDTGVAEQGLRMAGIDRNGLDDNERRLLEVIGRSRRGVGLKTIARLMNTSEKTVEDLYEPWLLDKGLLEITTKGRILTSRGRQVLGDAEQGRFDFRGGA